MGGGKNESYEYSFKFGAVWVGSPITYKLLNNKCGNTDYFFK